MTQVVRSTMLAIAVLGFAAPAASAQVWKIGAFEPTPAPAAEAAPAPEADVAAFVLDPPPPVLEPQSKGDVYGPENGDWSFTLGGSGSNDKDFDEGSFGFNAGLGWFLTDGIELGVRQTMSFSDFGESTWIGFTRLYGDFNFQLGIFTPFVGLNIGYVYGDEDAVNDTFEAAPELGVKIYVLEKTFIYGLMEYQFFFDEGDDADEAFDDGQFVYTLGIGFNF